MIITPFDGTPITEEHYNTVTELCEAHPTQNRMTWYHRLYKSKRIQPVYTTVEDNTLLQVYPLNDEYQARMKGEEA